MGKYLHLFEKPEEFAGTYSGTGYNEPWVSSTHGEISGITTAFTAHKSNHFSDRYVIDEVFPEPKSGFEVYENVITLYARYRPTENPGNPMAYSTLPPQSALCSNEFIVYFCGVDPDNPGVGVSFYPTDDRVQACSAGTMQVNRIDYNKRRFRLVGSYSGEIEYSAWIDELEKNTVTPALPFLPTLSWDEEREAYVTTDIYCRFVVNGVTEVDGKFPMSYDPDLRMFTLYAADTGSQYEFRFNCDTGSVEIIPDGGIEDE